MSHGRTPIGIVEEVATRNRSVALGLKLGREQGLTTVDILQSIIVILDIEHQATMSAIQPLIDRAKKIREARRKW